MNNTTLIFLILLLAAYVSGLLYEDHEKGCLFAALFVMAWFFGLLFRNEMNHELTNPDQLPQPVEVEPFEKFNRGGFLFRYIGIYPKILGAEIWHPVDGWKVYVKFNKEEGEHGVTEVKDKSGFLFQIEKCPHFNYGDFVYRIARRIEKERMSFKLDNEETNTYEFNTAVNTKRETLPALRPSGRK